MALVAAFCLFLGFSAAGAPAEAPADLLLTGGRVWTAEGARPWAEAVAIRDGRILYVGDAAGASRHRGPKTQVVPLGGRLVVPGFDDAHIHLMSGALVLRALRLLNSQGVTSVQDAGYTPAQLDADLPLMERALREGQLTVRITVSVQMSPGDVEVPVARATALAKVHRGPLLRFGAVKGYVDGVIEAHTAAMLEPYSADGSRRARGRPARERTHRGGRIEHIETISPPDYPRFKALGVIASMQPLHANPDQNNADVWSRNIGPERASRGFSWRNIEKAGGRLVFGSDWPVVTSDVMRGLYCAVARKTKEGTPPGGWLPELAVSLESALRHYTVDGAYASFEEAEKGSLAPGKRADLVVLSEDLFRQPPEAILETKVLLTVMDGRVVHRGPEFPAPSRASASGEGPPRASRASRPRAASSRARHPPGSPRSERA